MTSSVLPWGAVLREAVTAAVAGPASCGPSPLRTGFDDLDTITGGLRPGDLWVVTGLSGVGKSVLARDLLRSATRQRRGSLHLSRRDAAVDVARWLLAAEGRVPLHLLAGIELEDNARSRLLTASHGLAEAPAVLAHADGLDAAALAARVDDVVRVLEVPCELVVVDDLPCGGDQMTSLLAARQVAAARPVAVVVVVQDDLDDLELQSRRLEQAADVVLRLRRDDQERPASRRAGEADLVVLRNRRGPVATVTVAFQGHYGRFVDLPA